MQDDDFYQWLLKKYKGEKGVSSSRKANCNTVEKYEKIDLDNEFEKDSCVSIIKKLTYTKDDAQHSGELKHKIPINGNKYNGTQTYKQAVNLYIQFKKDISNASNPLPSNKIKEVVHKNGKINPSYIKKQNVNDNYDTISEKAYDIIYQKAEELIHKINEYGKKGKKRKLIFNESGMIGLLRNIKKYCYSRESFMSFILSLYILFKEKTRDKNQNYKNKTDHYYIYRFPDVFWEKNKITKQNMDNIVILRTEYSHSDEVDYNIQKQDKTFLDVVEELTGRKNNIPETTEEFQELQTKLMLQFVNALEELLQMVKNES